METYVALLRGINVGGNRKVEMVKLKQTLENLDFTAVKTFIASGNVIFRSPLKDMTEITKRIETAVETDFGFHVDVLLHDLASIKKLVAAIPDNWVNDKAMKCDVMFLWPAIDNRQILSQLQSNPEIEDVRYTPGAVIWRIDRDKVSKSRMFKIVGTPLHKQMTTRNPNTVRKIYELMKASV